MVDSMHARRHDETHEDALECEGKARVGMMKKNRREQDRLPDPELKNARSDENDLHRTVCDRQRELAEMKSQSGRGVEIEIHVVRQMESPEKRHLMICAMPPPERVVEKHDRHDRVERRLNGHSMQ